MKENKYWNPMMFGEKRDDEVVCYTVAIPNLPLRPNRRVKKFVKWISTLEGFVGFRPEYPRGTLLIFRTENDAKGARNLIRNYEGYSGDVGTNICEVYVPNEYVEDGDSVETD